jgi:hypothetical protein
MRTNVTITDSKASLYIKATLGEINSRCTPVVF